MERRGGLVPKKRKVEETSGDRQRREKWREEGKGKERQVDRGGLEKAW